jgi:hypothetical protein
MNLGLSKSRETMMAGVLGVLAIGACIYIYEEVFATSTPTPAPAPAIVTTPAPARPVASTAGAAKTVGTTSAALDPTLHMESMLVTEEVEYSGSGRNIFSPNSAPPIVIQKPVAAARPLPVAAPIPCPPNCPPPPPPPPIDLKFFGTAGSKGVLRAFLLHDDNVYLASAGDVVLRRYRVISIDAKTILVEDMQNNNRQTLPLLAN